MVEEVALVGAIASVVAVAASTGTAVYEYKRQAAASDEAAKQQENEAETARQTALFNERQQRRKIALLAGAQEATYAAAGFDISQGSPLESEIDLVKQGELEALAIRREGSIVGGERRFQASIAQFQSAGAAQSAAFAGIGGTAKAAGSGLSTYATLSKTPQSPTARTVITDWGV